MNAHQIRIAKDTLRMNPVMARIMGGMTVEEAQEVLKKAGFTDAQIAAIERGRLGDP